MIFGEGWKKYQMFAKMYILLLGIMYLKKHLLLNNLIEYEFLFQLSSIDQ